MAARTSYIGDTTFSIAMSFIFAGIFGLGIGFAYAELQGQGWAGGIMIAGLVAVIGGSVLSVLLTRKPLPPPNTVKAPTAPAQPQQSAYFVAGGASGAAAAEASEQGSISDKISAAGEAVAQAFDSATDRVRAAASGAGATFDDKTDAASDKVKDAAESANQRVRDAAKAAGDAARSMSEPATDAPPATIEPDHEEQRGTRPELMAAARDGNPDDLTKIKGIGPKLEETLNKIGIWHFDQIASWNEDEVAWMDTHFVQFKGRCSRDEWVSQAKVLAAGGETEYSQRPDKSDTD